MKPSGNRAIFIIVLSLLLPLDCFASPEAVRKMAKQLTVPVQSSKKPKIAILSFPYHNNRVSSGSSIISERLTTEVANFKKVRVVERRLIQKILEEQHLNETGVIDPGSAQKLGKLLGVDYLVTGTLIDISDSRTEINARTLRATTGEVVAASRGVIVRSWKDRPRTSMAPVDDRSEQFVEEPKPAENEMIRIGPRGGGAAPSSGGGYYGGK